jgi:tetratricopeptide (TPR) repeat protein
MSILDGMPKSPAEVTAVLELAVPLIDRCLGSIDLSPKSKEVVELLKQGLSIADIYGITKEERDALLHKGYQYIHAGKLEKARDWLLGVYQIETLDPRVHYALGVTFQLQGDVERAAKLFICSIALNADNPEGYLRLGECLLVAGEHTPAIECFKLAKKLSETSEVYAKAAAHASKMLEHANERLTRA